MGINKTGDPALDAAFKAAKKAKQRKDLIEGGLAPVAVSDEPVKGNGLIENSGFVVDNLEMRVLVPHMTQEELDTNTPAHGKGMVPIVVPRELAPSMFLQLLSNCYALYVTVGGYSNETVSERTGIPSGTVARYLACPEFKRALALRGVVPNSSGLTREQDLVLLTLTDPSDNKTLQQKLRACGVSFATYRAWMKQPLFRSLMESYTEAILSDNSHALVQLDKLAGQGDLAAIKFKLELSGRHDPARQQNIDVIAMMSAMMDIISRNVKDKEQLSSISQEFSALASQLRVGPKQIGA